MWIILGILSLIIIYLSIKYNKDIENYILNKVEQQKNRYKRLLKKKEKNKSKELVILL